MSPFSTVAWPVCSFLHPAIRPIRVDFPTPSGPTIPTMSPLGMSIEILSSATTLPYRWVTPLTDTTGPATTAAVESLGTDEIMYEIPGTVVDGLRRSAAQPSRAAPGAYHELSSR